MSKVTEKTIRENMTAANGASRHMPVGLRGSKDAAGYAVEVVYRATGEAANRFDGLKASEANAMVEMFRAVAAVTAPR